MTDDSHTFSIAHFPVSNHNELCVLHLKSSMNPVIERQKL